jgi:hypothetical protein
LPTEHHFGITAEEHHDKNMKEYNTRSHDEQDDADLRSVNLPEDEAGHS